MNSLKRPLLFVSAVIVGSLLYIALNWIPLIGPLTVGFIASRIVRGNVRNGFNTGICSGVSGFVLLIIMLNNVGFFALSGANMLVKILVGWVLLLWNIVGIGLAGLGGMLGSMFTYTERLFDIADRMGELIKPRYGYSVSDEKRDGVIRFVICPNCGNSNRSGLKTCSYCGVELKVTE